MQNDRTRGVWPKHREPELAAMKEAGVRITDIAKEAGVSIQVARYHLIDVMPITQIIDVLPVYPEELIRIDGDCMLTADWHCPYLSMTWVDRLIAVADALEISQLAIVGDFTDLKWFSKYNKGDRRGGVLLDIKVVLNVLELLLKNFKRVFWNHGNHEERMISSIGADIFSGMHEHSERLVLSPYRTMLLDDCWRLEHPKTYSNDAAGVAAKVAAIFHCNVATGHGHHIGYRHDVSGQFLGIDLGGLFDEQKQEYLYTSGATTMTRWTPGFWAYKDGRVRPFEDALVNWREWGVC